MNKEDTPRTQAMRMNVDYAIDHLHYTASPEGQLVPAHFAVVLERELNEALEELKYWNESQPQL